MTERLLKRWPKNKPKKETSYLCQIDDNAFEVMHYLNGHWHESNWIPFDDEYHTLVAWTELPAPLPEE